MAASRAPGNALVRRLLVEAAWHYQHRPGIGVALARRRKGQPGRVIAIADKAQQRLCRRFRKLAAEHKPAPKIAVAIARELAGFLWAALQPVADPGEVRRRDTRMAISEGNRERFGDGPRRRRMIRGTIARIGELAMRYGQRVPTRDSRLHVLPTKHCHVCSAAGDRGNHRISA